MQAKEVFSFSSCSAIAIRRHIIDICFTNAVICFPPYSIVPPIFAAHPISTITMAAALHDSISAIWHALER